jgi:hypothetical protein
MRDSVVDTVRRLLADPTNPDVARELVADDSVYVSLKHDSLRTESNRTPRRAVLFYATDDDRAQIADRVEHRDLAARL